MKKGVKNNGYVWLMSVPISLVYDLLDEIVCNIHEDKKYYILNLDAFKRCVMYNKLTAFVQTCRPFYVRKHFIDREITYKRFATIIRQICRCHNVEFFTRPKIRVSDELSYCILKPTNTI